MLHRKLKFVVRCFCISQRFANILTCILESPQVWEAKVFEFYQEQGSQEPTEVRRGQESYDAPNLRRRFFEEVDEYLERDYYDNIYLHKEVMTDSVKVLPCMAYCLYYKWLVLKQLYLLRDYS